MLMYIGIAVILFMGTFTKQAKWFYYSGVALLWMMMAFRHIDMGGFDALFYQKFFDEVPPIWEVYNYDSNYTWAYTLLNSFVKILSDQYIVYQIIYSTIAFAILCKLLDKSLLNYKEKCLFMLFFYCFRYMWDMWVILRQNMADLIFWMFSFVLYNLWRNYKNNKTAMKALLICFAVLLPAGFHSSGWVNLLVLPLLYYMQKINVKTKTVVITVVSISLYFILSPSFVEILNVISMIDTRYSMYANNDSSGNTMYYILRLVFFIFFACNYQRLSHRYKDYFFDMMGIMVIVGSINAPIIVRFVDYYAIGLYGLGACLPSLFAPSSRLPVLVVYGILLVCLLYRFLLVFDDGAFLDYRLGV